MLKKSPTNKSTPEQRARWSEMNRLNQRKRRERYIVGYGGKCECCGESRIEFLQVDHTGGGGTKERAAAGNGSRLMRHKIKEGFPAGMRVLCCNCHQAIGLYGVCPHSHGHLSRIELARNLLLATAKRLKSGAISHNRYFRAGVNETVGDTAEKPR
jgi:hypothetical protein